MIIRYVLRAVAHVNSNRVGLEAFLLQLSDDSHTILTTNPFEALSFTDVEQVNQLADLLSVHAKEFYFEVEEIEFETEGEELP